MADYWSQYQPATTQAVGNMRQIMTQPSAADVVSGLSPQQLSGFSTMAPQVANQVMTPGAEPIKIGPSAQPADPTNPNAQLAGGTATTPTAGGDYQATFMRIMGGLPATPQNLAAKESELAAAGITVKRNAEGVAGKIKLPTGQIVDVIQSAGTGGGGNWQWLTGGGGGFGGADLGNFQTGMFTGGGQYPLASVMGQGLAAPWTTPFNAPTDVTEKNDPGFQFRMKQAQNAIERSAASRGTLLTGGLLSQLAQRIGDQATSEYGGVYNRALGEYKMAHDIFNENQGNLFQRLYGISGLGENAAAGVGNALGAYGAGGSNTLTGIGNAVGSGTAAGGSAWGNAVGNIGNIAASSYLNSSQPTQPPSYNQNWTMASPDYGY